MTFFHKTKILCTSDHLILFKFHQLVVNIFIEEILSDSNNIFLCHEPEDIDKKGQFQNFSWFQCYICKLCMCIGTVPSTNESCGQDFMEKWLLFHPEMISALIIPLRKCVSYRGATTRSNKFKFLRAPSIWNLGVCLWGITNGILHFQCKKQ